MRETVDSLVKEVAFLPPAGHEDQLFPYVGRKHRGQARVIVERLSRRGDAVCDPFAGSGVIAYAIAESERQLAANEYEPYTNRMANAPWRLPDEARLLDAFASLKESVQDHLGFLYQTKCSCGSQHVLDSLFFDRDPPRYEHVTPHERVGRNGENVTYRLSHRCPNCGTGEKHFDDSDREHLEMLLQLEPPPVFNTRLIENSRINLSSEFATYGDLFPHRSKLALGCLWDNIQRVDAGENERLFLEDAFLSILPQAKFKDYRSKSQDLHCPPVKLREVNLLYRFERQFQKRLNGLRRYTFATNGAIQDCPIECLDFRDYLATLDDNSISLMLTDPPWADGNAYFEKAQLYHPWMNYSLMDDTERLEKEVIVSDAPSRVSKHDVENWWRDIGDFFEEAHRILDDSCFMALFFRPVPASRWLQNVNRIKLLSRQAGFEPLIPISLKSRDPSMRIQQSASYTFNDVVMVFLKLDPEHRRVFVGDFDVDQMVFQSAEALQEEVRNTFTFRQWRDRFRTWAIESGCPEINHATYQRVVRERFQRYCDQMSPGQYLPKHSTPFSGQLFDTRAVERFSTYVPVVISQLCQETDTFEFGDFLLGLAEYVENGTRSLIGKIEHLDIKSLLDKYAEPVDNGNQFRRRRLPALPDRVHNVLALDPYEFVEFIASLLERQGFQQVAVIGRSGDRGVDLQALDPDGRPTVVQCKRYLSVNVSAAPIQRLDSYARTRGASRKIVVSTSDFTRSAVEEAEITGTELINSEALEQMIAEFMPDWGSVSGN